MTEAELIYLVGEMRAGDQVARRRLIESHLGLVVVSAKRFRDREEVKSGAYLRLVEATDDFSRSTRPAVEMSRYLKGAVEHAAIDVARDEDRHAARLKRKFEHGSQSHMVTYYTKSDVGQWIKVSARVKSAPRITYLNDHDAMESLLVLAQDAMDVAVMRLKADGYSNKEVALRIGCSEQKVGRVLYELERRYVEKNP